MPSQALASNPTANLLYGKGVVYVKIYGSSSYVDMGECPKFDLSPEMKVEPFYSSRMGTKEKVVDIITEKGGTVTFDCVEASAQTLALLFLASDPSASSQTIGRLDQVSTAIVDDKFVELGKNNLTYTKIVHGAVTGTAFANDDTFTGTAGGTVKAAWVDAANKTLYCITTNTTAIVVGDTITSSGTGTATVTDVEVVEDVIVTDLATQTVRYVNGTDYDCDPVGGLLRIRATSAAVTPVFVSANYPTEAYKYIDAIAGSQITAEILFVGNPDQGPRWKVRVWKCTLTPSGSVGFISDSVNKMSFTASILRDDTHPECPYFKAEVLS